MIRTRILLVTGICILTVFLGRYLFLQEEIVRFSGPDAVVEVEEQLSKTVLVSATALGPEDVRIAGALATCSCLSGQSFPVFVKAGETKQLEFVINSSVAKLDKLNSVSVRFSGDCNGKAFSKVVNVSYRVFASNTIR